MEPKDQQLKELLDKWEAPAAPPTLAGRVFPRAAWWRWLWTGSIRVPVPAAAGLAVLAAVAVMLNWNRQPVSVPEKSVSLADFRPAERLEPRIIRSATYEGN